MNKNEIIQIQGMEYKEMTKQLLNKCALATLIPSKVSLIGIKPNLVAPVPAEFGGTTHPEVVAGIIEYLQENGFTNFQIMEGSWVGDKTEESFEVCGYRMLSEQYGVPLIDAQKEKSMPVQCGDMELQICECAKKVDFMINVPVMKGHCQTKITCALKNMKGLLPNKEKRHFHAMGLHRPIAHLGLGIHQDFILVDNICGDLDFEDGGNPFIMNRLFAGLDPVLIDAYVCAELHYKPEDVPYVKMAEELGVGSADLTRLSIRQIGEIGQQHQQRHGRQQERNDEERSDEQNRDAEPLVESLAVKHEEERAEHDARTGVILQDDDEKRDADHHAHLEEVARTVDREGVGAHHAGQRESRGDLHEFDGLQAERTEFEPRLGAVHLAAEQQRAQQQRQSREIGRIGEHMVEPFVEQQHHERRGPRHADPHQLLHVEVREGEDIGRALVVRRRGDRHPPRHHDQHVQQDRPEVHSVKDTMAVSGHTKGNRCSYS